MEMGSGRKWNSGKKWLMQGDTLYISGYHTMSCITLIIMSYTLYFATDVKDGKKHSLQGLTHDPAHTRYQMIFKKHKMWSPP